MELFSLEEKVAQLPGGLFDFAQELARNVRVNDERVIFESIARGGMISARSDESVQMKMKRPARWRGEKTLEPTIGLEPMTCRLRIDCSTN